MKGVQGIRRAALLLAWAAAITSIAQTAVPGGSRFYVTSTASRLIDEGLAAPAPTGSELAAFQEVPDPGVRFRPNLARATNVPWIDSNGWRFKRGVQKAHYARLPAGSAALAAAEAFTYSVDALLNPDPADVEELGKMLGFLAANDQPPLPPLVNIGVMDDKSPIMGEVLNMLTRRNLLYRVVTSPDPALDLTVQLGTQDFPAESAINPSDFAARVRARLGDDKRLVRLYGTSTMIAHLTGEAKRARLHLLVFSGNRRRQVGGDQAVRVRLLGRYRPTKFAGYGSAQDARLTDIRHPENTTEFWVPDFQISAIVDLEPVK
jgi:hypothetical protein